MKHGTVGPFAFFTACLLPLLAGAVVRILTTYHYSEDRGLWPLYLAFDICLSVVYASLACIPAHLTRNFNAGLGLRHHILLGAVLCIYNLSYFLAKPDWGVHVHGRVVLSLFQKIIYHPGTFWAIYAISYTLLAVRLWRSKSRCTCR